MLNTNDYIADLQYQLANANMHATDGRNDGWTQEAYKEEVVRLTTKLKSIGRQLECELC